MTSLKGINHCLTPVPDVTVQLDVVEGIEHQHFAACRIELCAYCTLQISTSA